MKIYIYNRGLRILLIALCLSFSACQNQSSEKSKTKTSSKKGQTKTTSYFQKYSGEIFSELLTKADVAKYSPFDMDKARLQDDSGEYYKAYYFQRDADEDRERRVEAMGIDFDPKPYAIGVKRLNFISTGVSDPVKYFKNSHRTLSEEDKEKAGKTLNKGMDDFEELDETGKNIGKGLTAGLLNKMKFMEVEGIEDATAWDYMNDALAILIGGANFEVMVDIGEDLDKNIELAKKIGREIIDKCN